MPYTRGHCLMVTSRRESVSRTEAAYAAQDRLMS